MAWRSLTGMRFLGLEEKRRLASHVAKQGYGEAMQGLRNITWAELPGEIKDYILEHPTTAIEIAYLLTTSPCPATRSLLC